MAAKSLFDPMAEARNNSFYTQRFLIRSDKIQALEINSLKNKLKWGSVKFTKGNKGKVPKKRGLYIFIIQNKHKHLPQHGYIAYVGKTDRTFFSRYGEYLNEQGDYLKARPTIHLMLQKWCDSLYFFYAEIKDKRTKLEPIETKFLNALMPPYNTNDFDADIKKQKKMWGVS